jgi:hypothetical protein
MKIKKLATKEVFDQSVDANFLEPRNSIITRSQESSKVRKTSIDSSNYQFDLLKKKDTQSTNQRKSKNW